MFKNFEQDLDLIINNFDKENIINYQLLLVKLYELALFMEEVKPSKKEKESVLTKVNLFLKDHDLEKIITIEDLNYLFDTNFLDLDFNNNYLYICLINMLTGSLNSSDDIILSYKMKEFIDAIVMYLDNNINNDITNSSANNEIINAPIETPSFSFEENNYPKFIDDEIYNQSFKSNKDYLKEYLIRKEILDYSCTKCGLSDWQNNPLMLILYDKTNKYSLKHINDLEFLCPNCYSQLGENNYEL